MRKNGFNVLFLTLAIACLLAPQPATAQEDAKGPLLWVSYVTAEPGMSGQLGRRMAEEGAKIYDDLVADGHAFNWGVTQAVNHFPGDDWTHMEFINFKNWAGVNEFISRFMAGMQAMTPEARAADAAKWDELTVHGSHYDMIARNVYVSASGGRPGYIMLSTFGTQPGTGDDDVVAMYGKWRAPIMDRLKTDGKILGHGVLTPYIHGPGQGGDVTAWYTMADLGALDAVEGAADAAEAARTPEQSAEWMADMQKHFERPGKGNHTDRLLVVTHYKSAGPPPSE